MDFLNYLKVSAEQIDEELDSLLSDYFAEVKQISPYIEVRDYLDKLINQFIEACKGGKRLRGVLVKLGYELATGENNPAILKPAAAYEIFQTAILAHDDIIDKSPTRRGRDTIYRSLGGDHYALSQTICLGDIGFFLAQKIIGDSNFPDSKKISALRSFNNSMLLTANGEMLDIEIPRSGKPAAEEVVLTISLLKTARYTLIGPLRLGAILGGADQALLENINSFGENLGIAFQIQDDILGMFGEENQLGKSITSDAQEGKYTILFTQALKKASAKQKKDLLKLYGTEEIGMEGLIKVRQIFIDTDALSYSQQKALEYVTKAKKVILQLTSNHKKQKLLAQLAYFMVERKK